MGPPSFNPINIMKGSGQWLLYYARNANKPIRVAFAITTKKVTAPRPLASMRLLEQAESHPRTRKTETRND